MSTPNANQHKDARQSTIATRQVVIKRTDPSAMRTSMRMSSSMGSRNSGISPGVFQSLSSSGVTEMKGTRQREKKDLQDLNERFASYIDKVHFLEANCKRLEAENEALRNRTGPDFAQIRKDYENELSQARAVIDELTTAKGASEAKLAGLQDEIDSLREINQTLESQQKDLRKKFDALGHQIGEYEGDLETLRHRVGSLEDENAKLRELLGKVQDQCKRLRADLDIETAAHIEADCLAQTKGEEAQFYRDILDELEKAKPEPVQIKGMDYNDFWKSEMQKSIREINAAYDDKLDAMQIEMDNKYATQINALKNGNVKDNMSANRSKEEISRLKGQLSEKNAANAEMSAQLSALRAEREELSRRVDELEREIDGLNVKYERDVSNLREELDSVMEQLKLLMDAKMSLELEIACYKKLLEGEESRVGLRTVVEDALGSQSKGNAQNALEAALKDQSTLKESTGSLTVQRSSKGPIAFKSMDHSGGNITIENTSSGSRQKTQNLKGWKMIKTANGRNSVNITLNDYELLPGKVFTLWARGAKEEASDASEQIADNFSFGVGTCVWKLCDESGAEKATLNARFTG